MDGVAVGVVCYRSADEAAVAACSSVAGVTSAGVASCEAPTVAGGVLSYTLNIDGAAGRVSRPVSVSLPGCEPVDAVSYGPAIGAFITACVLIVVTRTLYAKVFNRESY